MTIYSDDYHNRTKNKIKIIVDCSTLTKGGGVQVALSFLHFAKNDSDFDIVSIVPYHLLEQFSSEIGNAHRINIVHKENIFQKILSMFIIKKIEFYFKPQIIFTIFGPSYFFTKNKHIVGYALPLLIYPSHPPLKDPGFLQRKIDNIKIFLFRKSDALIVETETVSQRLRNLIGINYPPVEVIKNSYNPLFKKALKYHKSKRVEQRDSFCILIPSAWYPHKNLITIPELAAAMNTISPNFKYVFQFTLDKKSLEWALLEDLSKELGVLDSIEPLGSLKLDELAAAYLGCDLIYLPTLREASTAVYPEAFIAERPLATTDIDFARELCGDAALYVNPAKPIETAHKIVQLLHSEADKHNLVRLGKTQLKINYPSPEQKYAQQKAIIMKYISEN